MDEIVLLIGSFTISVLFILFPILTTCGFILDWDVAIVFLLTLTCVGECLILTIIIKNSVDY